MARLLPALALATTAAALLAQSPRTEPPTEKPKAEPSWPSYRGSTGLHGVAPGSLGDGFELAWTFKTKGAILSSPVVAGKTVYFGSSDQSVYAVDAETGAKRWAFATDDMVDAPPLVLDGCVYIGSADFFVYALDAATGTLRWKFETEDKILGAANYARMKDGSTRLLVGSYDGKLYCFDAANGKKLWAYQTDNYVNGTPAVHEGKVVFGGCDAVLHVVSVETGKSLQKIDLGADCHVAGSVALAGTKAYFGHYGNAFLCVDLTRPKKPVWTYESKSHGFISSPSILPDRVIFGGKDKSLHCVGRDDGKSIWTFPTRRKIDGSPVVCGDRVVFGSGDGRLYLLDTATGKLMWKYEIGRPVFSSPAVAGGWIYVGANDDSLYAFRPKASKPAKRR